MKPLSKIYCRALSLTASLAIFFAAAAALPVSRALAQSEAPVPALRGLTSTEPSPQLQSEATLKEGAARQYAPVESYFNLGPNRDTRGANMQPATVDYSMKNGVTAGASQKKHGFLWHVMDNIGVPMRGIDGPVIDPSIKTVSVIPAPKLPSERALTKQLKVVNQNAGESTTPAVSTPEATPGTQPAQQKIPESELEGTIYETPASKEMPSPAQ